MGQHAWGGAPMAPGAKSRPQTSQRTNGAAPATNGRNVRAQTRRRSPQAGQHGNAGSHGQWQAAQRAQSDSVVVGLGKSRPLAAHSCMVA